jgi:hypothetical protein
VDVEEFERRLDAELGVEPMVETQALWRALRQGHPFGAPEPGGADARGSRRCCGAPSGSSIAWKGVLDELDGVTKEFVDTMRSLRPVDRPRRPERPRSNPETRL